MIYWTAYSAKAVSDRGLNGQKLLEAGSDLPEAKAAVNAALELLAGILDGSIVVRESGSQPPATQSHLEFVAKTALISAGRYRRDNSR